MKLPRIVANQNIPGQIPGGYAGGEPFGVGAAGALAEGSQQVGRSAMRTTDAMAHVDHVLRTADARVEYDSVFSKLKQEFADRDIALRDQGVDPDQYPKLLQDSLKEITEKYSGGMKYPESQALLRRGVEQFGAVKLVEAKYKARDLKDALVNVREGIQQDEDANTAVFGSTPEERQAAFGRGLDRPQTALRELRLSGAQAESMTKNFLANVELGSITRDFQNPALQGQVIKTLVEGGYKHIPPERQYQRAQTLQNEQERQGKLQEARYEKARKAGVDLYERDARDGVLTMDRLNKANDDRVVTGEDYRRIRDYIEKPKETPSNPDVLTSLSARAHRTVPTVSLEELNRAHAAYRANQPGLSYKDWKELSDKVVSRTDHLRSEGRAVVSEGRSVQGEQRSIAMQHQAQAEQLIDKALGLSSPYDVLNKEDQKLQDLALRELTARSSAFPQYGGTENPLAVAKEIVTRIAPEREKSIGLKADTVRKTLIYQTGEELIAALAAKRISPSAYEIERQKFLSIDRAMKRIVPPITTPTPGSPKPRELRPAGTPAIAGPRE